MLLGSLKYMMFLANVLVCPFHIHEWRSTFCYVFISDPYFALLTFPIIFVNDFSTIL
jgi:hypothetical protein